MTTDAKRIAVEWVDGHGPLIVDAHQRAWELAELGLQEHETGRLLADILAEQGFAVERGVAGLPSAFVATYGSGEPVIGIMGELDALPGLSQKVVPYREPLVAGAAGHGCGHCSHAATALGGALAVKAAMDAAGLPGTIKCFGCPAEETLLGKVFMVRDGVFQGVAACLAHHPGAINGVFLGGGNAMNSARFEFFGLASHAGGSPELGISALDAVELMDVGVNFMREHVVQEARIHYCIEEGGQAPNVVPAYARSWYYVRAPTRDLVDRYYDWVLKIADGADLMARTTHKVRFLTGVHNIIPNRGLAELVVANMREIGAPTYSEEELAFARELARSIPREDKRAALEKSELPGALELMDVDLNTRIYDPYGEEKKGGGSSDVAEVAWNLPTQEFNTTQFVTGSPGHSWQNTAMSGTSVGHKSTLFASKVMAATVIDLLTSPEALARAREEWQQRMKGLVYRSPLPPDLQPSAE